MSTFTALRVHRVEGGTRSRFDAVSLDDLTPGEVVIRVAYSCLNYKDALAVTGNAPITRGAVRTAGIDLSGVVESSADGSFAPGDRVLVTGSNLGESLDGGFAQFAASAQGMRRLQSPFVIGCRHCLTRRPHRPVPASARQRARIRLFDRIKVYLRIFQSTRKATKDDDDRIG